MLLDGHESDLEKHSVGENVVQKKLGVFMSLTMVDAIRA